MQTEAQTYEQVKKTIEYIQLHFTDQPSLEDIARVMGLSPSRAQRVFTQWCGVSPKQFVQFLTKEHAKKALVSSSILEASYKVGLSGSSRLYDLFVSFEGMTPGEYKAQGPNIKINFGVHPTPFGLCLLAITDRGICHLSFLDKKFKASEVKKFLLQDWPLSRVSEDMERTQAYIKKIFSTERRKNKKGLALFLKGTPFKLKVWEALLSIPFGSLCTYGDVAQLIEKPTATRAVASAIAQNNISLLVPCHRVIRRGGDFNQYRWGATRKKAIIGWEQSCLLKDLEG